MAGIYIHIPFCRQACHYCDFHFSTNLTYKGRLINTLLTEIELQRDYLLKEPIETIYFGGGSPSLLTPSELSSIIATIHRHYTIIPDPEITLEGNPDDLTFNYLKSIKKEGINRLSIGVQSFNKDVLKFLNRVHSAGQSIACLEATNATEFNFSLDLIYGIPNANHNNWINDLELTKRFKPNHISAYCLTIEENTVFGNWQRRGKLPAMDEEFAADQYEILIESLEGEGYEQYEVSNFALKGYYSKHNSSYWKQKKYLGIGPGAHSFDGSSRKFNIANNIGYMQGLEAGIIPFTQETLTIEDKINEYLLTTLRTNWGCNLTYFESAFSFDFIKRHAQSLKAMSEQEMIYIKENTLFLTKKGKLLADKITSDLFVISL